MNTTEKPEGKKLLGDVGIEIMILTYILRKQEVRMWSGLNCPRTETNGSLS
jgi:hypothetical protein